MRYVILHRGFEAEELYAARSVGFFCTNSRMDLKPGDICIPRYSALPYYDELERDVTKAGAQLLNTHRQHRYAADVLSYAKDLGGLTPKTWAMPSDVPIDEPGAFILKGATNSKKFLWSTQMFSKDRASIMQVYNRLLDDTMIGQQAIYIRKYVPLRTFMKGLWDLPITREFRFFVYNGKLLSGGYYWASHYEDVQTLVSLDLLDARDTPPGFLLDAIAKVKDNIPFFAIDVAETADNNWIVIELNDGQQSGLSMNSPYVLYKNLWEGLHEHRC